MDFKKLVVNQDLIALVEVWRDRVVCANGKPGHPILCELFL